MHCHCVAQFHVVFLILLLAPPMAKPKKMLKDGVEDHQGQREASSVNPEGGRWMKLSQFAVKHLL